MVTGQAGHQLLHHFFRGRRAGGNADAPGAVEPFGFQLGMGLQKVGGHSSCPGHFGQTIDVERVASAIEVDGVAPRCEPVEPDHLDYGVPVEVGRPAVSSSNPDLRARHNLD